MQDFLHQLNEKISSQCEILGTFCISEAVNTYRLITASIQLRNSGCILLICRAALSHLSGREMEDKFMKQRSLKI